MKWIKEWKTKGIYFVLLYVDEVRAMQVWWVFFKTMYQYIFQIKFTRWWYPCFSFQAMFTIKKTIWFREGFEVLILTVKTTYTGLRFLSISHSVKTKEWKFEFAIFDFIEQLIDKKSGACVKTSYQCLELSGFHNVSCEGMLLSRQWHI